MPLIDDRSIIAIDPTSRGVAFVSFERGVVMDWGERLHCGGGAHDSIRVVERLVERYAAEVVVLEDPGAAGCARRPRVRAFLRAITKSLQKKGGVGVRLVSRDDVRSAWRAVGAGNKDAAAVAIAGEFPELSAVLPRRRRPGWSEDPRSNIFDAASLALHACGRADLAG